MSTPHGYKQVLGNTKKHKSNIFEPVFGQIGFETISYFIVCPPPTSLLAGKRRFRPFQDSDSE
jgi:hypothetical protein